MAKKPSHEALVMRHDCEASFSQLFNLYARNRANESQFSSHGCFRSKGSVLRTARPSPIDFCYISKTGSTGARNGSTEINLPRTSPKLSHHCPSPDRVPSPTNVPPSPTCSSQRSVERRSPLSLCLSLPHASAFHAFSMTRFHVRLYGRVTRLPPNCATQPTYTACKRPHHIAPYHAPSKQRRTSHIARN